MKLFTFLSCFILANTALSQEEIERISESNNQAGHSLIMEVLVSPNPASDKCYITGEEGATCTLYSSSGTYIGKWVMDQSNSVLLTDLPSGVLQAVIEKNGVTVVKRIVII